MARIDRSYLERMNGGRWRVVVPVPRELQKQVGKTKLKEALGTDSLVVANQLKHPVIARLKATIDRYAPRNRIRMVERGVAGIHAADARAVSRSGTDREASLFSRLM